MIGSHSQAGHPHSGLFFYRNKVRILERDRNRADQLEAEIAVLRDELEDARRRLELNRRHEEFETLQRLLSEREQQIAAHAGRMGMLPFRLADLYTRLSPRSRIIAKVLMIHVFGGYYVARGLRRALRGSRGPAAVQP